jgi:phosphoglycerate dehydrogenase-like enzyme
MNILFAAPENAWGGFLHMVRERLPHHHFEATGRFQVDSIKGFHILIPTMSPITRGVIAQADCLRLIQQCGAGIEGVDLEAAREYGVWVANVPTGTSGNADSVAELGIYMMIGLARNEPAMADSLQNRKMGQPQGRALGGRTVGLIGLGGIGQALVRRLKAFDMEIIGIKRTHPSQAREALDLAWVGGPQELKTLLKRSDFVILCLPHTRASDGIINSDTLRAMKPGAFLINLSRGGLVERDALEKALADGIIAGAGLDVFWEEPPDPKDPIFGYNVMATPHIAGSTDRSMAGIVDAVVENIMRLERNREPLFLQ